MNDNDRAIVGLVMVAHAMVHTYELSVPILVGVWLAEFGASPATMGAVVTVGYGLFGAGALPGGMLADVFGSRRLILACLVGMGGSFLVLSVAPGIPAIAVALLLWGGAASVYHPSGLALISKGVTERGEAFAYHGMAGNFGIAAGPLATTLLLVALDWRTTVALLAAPAAVGAGLALYVDIDEAAAVDGPSGHRTDGGRDHDGAADPGETPADGPRATPSDGPEAGSDGADDPRAGSVTSLPEFLSGTRTLFTGSFLLVFLVVVSSGLYYRGVLTFLPEILDGYEAFAPVEVAGREVKPSRYAYVGLLTVGMAGQFVGGKLTDRVAPERGIAGAFAALAVLAVAFVPAVNLGLWAFVAVGTALGFCLFLVQPMYQATVAERTPPGTRGLSYGYTYLGVFGVGALGGVVAGAVLTYATPAALFGLLAGVAAFASLVGVVLVRR